MTQVRAGYSKSLMQRRIVLGQATAAGCRTTRLVMLLLAGMHLWLAVRYARAQRALQYEGVWGRNTKMRCTHQAS